MGSNGGGTRLPAVPDADDAPLDDEELPGSAEEPTAPLLEGRVAVEEAIPEEDGAPDPAAPLPALLGPAALEAAHEEDGALSEPERPAALLDSPRDEPTALCELLPAGREDAPAAEEEAWTWEDPEDGTPVELLEPPPAGVSGLSGLGVHAGPTARRRIGATRTKRMECMFQRYQRIPAEKSGPSRRGEVFRTRG